MGHSARDDVLRMLRTGMVLERGISDKTVMGHLAKHAVIVDAAIADRHGDIGAGRRV
jgi:hypothetical protein